jgi:hypothetical protein
VEQTVVEKLAPAVVCYLVRVFMRLSNVLKAIKSPEHRLALLIAMVGDAIQIFALPLFAAGGLSPADALLDAAMAVILIRMLGWHWAFLPTLVAEMTPGFDLFPTWSAAVLYVTLQSGYSGDAEILPPGPARRPW